MQQRTAEKIEVVPQMPEETVEMLKLVSQERVQQRSTVKIEDFPQYLELVSLARHARVQQRSAEKIEGVPQTPEETVEAVTLVPRETSRLFGHP